MISLFRLYLIFVYIGAILLGGGYVILPIIQHEFITKRNLISNEDMLDFYALAQSLPGIIAANTTMFIGYKLRKTRGAIVSMLGIITIPFLCIVILSSLIALIVDSPITQNIFKGIGISVIVLIWLTTKEIWQASTRNKLFYFLLVISLLMLLFKFSPIQTIITGSILGILIQIFNSKKEGNL